MALPALMTVTIKINQVVNRPTDWFKRSMPREIFNKKDMRPPAKLERL
jgi:hypothetical protein